MDLADVVTLSDAAAPSVAFLPLLIPALVGLAGSVIGGAMKNSAAQQQAAQQYSNDIETAKMQRAWNIEDRDEARAYSEKAAENVYTDLVANAEKAGFNPLTALRAGGGVVQNAAAGFAPLSRVAPTRQAPYQGAMGDAVSSAGGYIADFMQNFDPMADDRREAEYNLINAQIRNLNASTKALGSQSFKVPTRTAGTAELRPSGKAAVLSSLPAETQTPQRTNPYPEWMNAEVNPWQPDMQNWEDHLGDSEIGSMAGGLLQLGQDVVWNGYRFVKWLGGKFKDSGGKPYRAAPDPYDRKMYIPPQMYRR